MNAGRWVIAVGCAYELCALPSWSPLPTITEMVQRGSRVPWVGRVALWLWLGAVVDHFIWRGDA